MTDSERVTIKKLDPNREGEILVELKYKGSQFVLKLKPVAEWTSGKLLASKVVRVAQGHIL